MTLIDRRIASLAWWQLRHTKRSWAVLAIAAIPVVAGLLTLVSDGVGAAQARGRPYAFEPGYVETLQFAVMYTALPLVALLLAGGLVSDEVEDRTLSYLLVRPILRQRLYLSKLAPIALTAAVLGAAQALALGLLRLVAWLAFGQGSRTEVRVLDTNVHTLLPTVDTGEAILVATIGGVLACFLLGAVLACLFGFVSLTIPRFHFVANLLVYLTVEVPFSQFGLLGFGFFTPTLHAMDVLALFDLTRRGAVPVAGLVLAIPMLVALTVFWAVFGMHRMSRRDLNIASASS